LKYGGSDPVVISAVTYLLQVTIPCIVFLLQQLQQDLQANPGSHPFDEVPLHASFFFSFFF